MTHKKLEALLIPHHQLEVGMVHRNYLLIQTLLEYEELHNSPIIVQVRNRDMYTAQLTLKF